MERLVSQIIGRAFFKLLAAESDAERNGLCGQQPRCLVQPDLPRDGVPGQVGFHRRALACAAREL